MRRRNTRLASVVLCALATAAAADEVPAAGGAPEPAADGGPDLPLRNALVIGTGATLVAAFGLAEWWDEGFSGGFDSESEGWFGENTEYGGVDKFGHAYASYAGVRLLTPFFEAVGNDHGAATRLATASSAVTFAAIEILDGFSEDYAFGREDFVANLAGTALGYLLESHERLDKVLDFRLDYRKRDNSKSWEPFAD